MLVHTQVRLFKNDMDWEGGVVEAPFMWKHDGRYYLFYSGNGYGGDKYAVGFATSTSLFGAPACSICSCALCRHHSVIHGCMICEQHPALLLSSSLGPHKHA